MTMFTDILHDWLMGKMQPRLSEKWGGTAECHPNYCRFFQSRPDGIAKRVLCDGCPDMDRCLLNQTNDGRRPWEPKPPVGGGACTGHEIIDRLAR